MDDRKANRFFHLYLSSFNGDTSDLNEVDEHIADKLCLTEIVNSYGPIYNWEVLSTEEVFEHFEDCSIEEAEDPAVLKKAEKERKKAEKKLQEIAKFEENLDSYQITKSDVIQDVENGVLTVENKVFGKVEIPIDVVYGLIEQKTSGDATLTNSFGEKILNLIDTGMLNTGLADILVFNSVEDRDNYSMFNDTSKGGIFIRDDGRLAIGDISRTKYLEVNLTALVKELYVKGLIGEAPKFLKGLKLIK